MRRPIPKKLREDAPPPARTIARVSGIIGHERRSVLTDHLFPYVVATAADGVETLLNRHYRPLWRRKPGGPAEPALDYDPKVPFTWLYQPPEAPSEHVEVWDRCLAVLAAWGLPAPTLADVAPAAERLRIRSDEVDLATHPEMRRRRRWGLMQPSYRPSLPRHP